MNSTFIGAERGRSDLDWPFEPVVQAKKRMDTSRAKLMQAASHWTTGQVPYASVDAAMNDFEKHVASFKAALHALREESGIPRPNPSAALPRV